MTTIRQSAIVVIGAAYAGSSFAQSGTQLASIAEEIVVYGRGQTRQVCRIHGRLVALSLLMPDSNH